MVAKKIAAIYTRVSTSEQAEKGYSIEEQEKQAREHCDKLGIIVGNVYSDKGISGKNMNKRPGVTALMMDAEKQKFNMVIVWKLNRISRSQKDTLGIIDRFNANNIELVSITENLETVTAMGKLHFAIMSSFAEFERNQIAENVSMGMNARAREGRWNGGIVLGYDLAQRPESFDREDKILVVNDKEAELVRYIFSLYLKGLGYKAIANKLNHEGYVTKKGNHFSVVAVRDTLTNPLYCGMIRYGVRKDYATKKRKGLNSNPIIVPGIHEAIISKSKYNSVQDLIKSKGGKHQRSFVGSYPLTGILKCPECGASMVASRTVATLKDGSKRTTRYYNCGAFKSKGSAVCHANGVRADDVESAVFSQINRLLTSEPFLDAVLKRVNDNRRKRIMPAEKKIEKIRKDISILEKNREMYYKMIESGKLDSDMLILKLKEIADKIEHNENLLNSEKENAAMKEVVEVPHDLVKNTLSQFQSLLSKMKTNEEKKTLLHLLIDEINLGPERRVDSIVIRFNKMVVEYANNERGLPIEGNPLSAYSRLLDYGAYDFKASI